MRVLSHVNYNVAFDNVIAYIVCNIGSITNSDEKSIDDMNCIDKEFDIVLIDTNPIDDMGKVIIEKTLLLYQDVLIVTSSVCDVVISRLEVGWNVENGVDREFRILCAQIARDTFEKQMAKRKIQLSEKCMTYSLRSMLQIPITCTADPVAKCVAMLVYKAKQLFPDSYIAVCMNNGQISGLSTSNVSLLRAVYDAMSCDMYVSCGTYVGVSHNISHDIDYYLSTRNVARVVVCIQNPEIMMTYKPIMFSYARDYSISHTTRAKDVDIKPSFDMNILYNANIGFKSIEKIVKRTYDYAKLHFKIVYTKFAHSVCIVSNTTLVSSCPPLSNIEDSVRYVTDKSTDWVVSKSKDVSLDPTFSCATEYARQQSKVNIIRDMDPNLKRKLVYKTKHSPLVLVTNDHSLTERCIRIASENRVFMIVYCRSRNNKIPITKYENVLRACKYFNICLVEF